MQTLHSNATTTYHIRRQIQQAEGSNVSVGRRFGVSATTVKRWRNRDWVEDASSSNRILRTTLTAAEEYVVLELRKSLLLPTDDLLRVSHEFVNPKLTRSALGRLLRREGLSQLKDLIPQEEKARSKSFKDYEPGYIHIDIKYLPQMPGESSRRYLFAAIDRATRWVYLEIHEDKSAQSA